MELASPGALNGLLSERLAIHPRLNTKATREHDEGDAGPVIVAATKPTQPLGDTFSVVVFSHSNTVSIPREFSRPRSWRVLPDVLNEIPGVVKTGDEQSSPS